MDTSPTRRLDSYLELLDEHKASDLLLMEGSPPRLRIDGRLEPFGNTTLSARDTDAIIRSAFTAEQAETYEREKEIDFSFTWHDKARFRANAFRQRGSAALSLRTIPLEIPTFDDLGLPEVIDTFVQLPQGLILLTGPTGGGKSTTQASIIDCINAERPCHILTIEDPIEYLHSNKMSAVTQREVGTDTDSFARGLRSALREDPDVLLLGEMRDLESIQTALTIAETGHLVLATLHTNDTAQALDRIIDVFPAERQQQIRVQLAGCLQGIIYQRLVPKIGGGRVAAFEVLLATFAVRNLVKNGKTDQIRNAITTGQDLGMQTLELSLSQLVEDQVVDYEEAVGWSVHPKEISRPLGT